MKTVYAAAWSFARGFPAYGFGDLARVFANQHVVAPENWYAHAPVYPPFTLGFVAPLTLLPMVEGIYAWMGLCALLSAAAAYAAMRSAGQELGLGRFWRLLLLALFASSPLLSSGLELGNVSVAVSALCLLAVLGESAKHRCARAVALASGLLLKPHLALWFVVGLLLLTETRGRTLALRACAVAAAVATIIMASASIFSPAGAQIGSYRATLHAEIAGGSMSPANRELIGVPAQITALGSLIGYLVHRPEWAAVLSYVVLLLLAAALAWASRRLVPTAEHRLLTLGAWSAFGLIATYHRAADGTALFVLLPWLVARLRRRVWDPLSWLLLASYIVMSCEATWEYWEALELHPGLWHLARLILYRQAPLGAAGLAFLLIGVAVLRARQGALRPLRGSEPLPLKQQPTPA